VFKHGILPLDAHLQQHQHHQHQHRMGHSPKCRQRLNGNARWCPWADAFVLSAASAGATSLSSSSALLARRILIFKVVWLRQRAQRQCYSPRTTFWLQVNCECSGKMLLCARDLL